MATQITRPAALVTGGAIRVGKAIALALAQAGYDIALHYHSSADAATQTQQEILGFGVDCQLFPLNLQECQDFSTYISQIQQAFPKLCVLVNSASGYEQASIAETQAAQFDRLIAVNLRAPFLLSQAFAKHCDSGNIINIIDNKIGFKQFKYAAHLLSKKSLAEFTQIAALEFAPQIRVNGISPGVILPATTRSEEYLAWRTRAIPVQRRGEPKHITDTLLFLLNNDFINGQILTVDGGENIMHTGLNAGDYDQSKV